jgi:hypothetical protein
MITRAAKNPARRCIVALHACLRARCWHAQIRQCFEVNATGGSAVPAIRRIYDPPGYRVIKLTALSACSKGCG